MLRIADLIERKRGDELYISIAKPYVGEACKELKTIAKNIVKYRDNMETCYASSRGFSIPAKYIADLLAKCAMRKGIRRLCRLKKLFEIMVYGTLFLIASGIALGCSYSMVNEAQNSRLVTLPSSTVERVDYTRLVSTRSDVSRRYCSYIDELKRGGDIIKNATYRSVYTFVPGKIFDFLARIPQHNRSDHFIFGIAIFLLFTMVCILFTASNIIVAFRRSAELKRVEAKKFKALPYLQRLFECLQKESNEEFELQETLFYKDEIFLKEEIIEALRPFSKAPTTDNNP